MNLTSDEQIAALHSKVDALYSLVEQLNRTLSGIAPVLQQLDSHDLASAGVLRDSSGSEPYHPLGLDRVSDHKDVLLESPYPEQENRQANLISPEVQTQRLTAQLTAAYNRIAALEEQLLSQRIQ